MVDSGLRVTADNLKRVAEAVAFLSKNHVLVGVPDEKAGRREGEITNAALAYIHENGAPEVNIPARPFLRPAINAGHAELRGLLKKAGEFALAGNLGATERQLHRVGIKARDMVKAKLRAGPFEPLKPATIAARRRRSAGSRYRRKAKSAEDVKPLIDTAQMLNAVNYVIRRAGR